MDISSCRHDGGGHVALDILKPEAPSYLILITDAKGIIEYVNSAFEQVTGYGRAEVIGKNVSLLKSGEHDTDFFRRLWETVDHGGTFRDVFVNRGKNGLVFCEIKTISPIKDARGNVVQFISVGRRVGHRTEEHDKLSELAHYDPLTGLPNRLLFQDRLQNAMARARRADTLIAVMFLDLDHFKAVNDTLGHPVGDGLLKAAAQRLKSFLRDSDTVGRMSGDEFMAVLESIADADQAAAVAQKIVDGFREPFVVEGQEVHCTCSLGTTLFPLDGAATVDELVHHADMAMYEAKQHGRNNHRFYSEELNARVVRNKRLEERLRQASDNDGFFLSYQPQIDAATGRMCAAEALLRWRQPETGLESPKDFFPILETAGLYMRVGEWVLRSACRRAADWHRPGLPRLRVGVNVSARQFWHRDFPEMCMRVLHETGLDPDLICLDVTEEALLRDEHRSRGILRLLKDRGLNLCVDDFAKNNSSLSYLRHTPIDLLKIHRPYIQQINSGEDEKRIIAAIITLAHHLGLKVTGLGVATREQLAFLLGHGCDTLQGYYFSEPLPEEQAGAALSEAVWRNRNFLTAAQV